ncbi:armadillo-type protein [Armillaria luteobubalina]|uniref:Armadillo-type protein n=1 Tax=Armillaria luteobubalina TaxID=153913 RepID=A0AA39Q454_9AGAR|nr:armadillo-type protein [Armillaria luteobubalina]
MLGSTLKPIGLKEVADNEQRGDDAKHAGVSILSKTVTEKRLSLEEGEKERARVAAEETIKDEPRISTASSPSELSRSHPSPLDLSTDKATIPEPLPSALATARIIDDLSCIPYPEGFKSPRVELNRNARDGKFIYDRDFLLQFMSICKEKPDSLPALDAIGIVPSKRINNPMSLGKSGRHRQGSGTVSPPSSAIPMPSDGWPSQMQRTVRQDGPGGASMGSKRTRTKRGEKRNDRNRVPTGLGSSADLVQASSMLEPVAQLQQSANRWDRRLLRSSDPSSPDVVARKVRALLNKFTVEKFDSLSDQIIAWANSSQKEKDSRTLIQVIRLVFESAVDQATWSEMYARLCRKMMEQISPKIQDDGIKNAGGNPIAGGQLFRKYLLNRCQDDFDRGWGAKEATAAAAAFKAIEDQAAKAAVEKKGDAEGEITLYSEEYYAAQEAKRQGLGLVKFMGELFKLQMLTERIMHNCVKELLRNAENSEEEEIVSLCILLTTVGGSLDTLRARDHMDVYFSCMKELMKDPNVSLRMQFKLQDVLELRERMWVSRHPVAIPTTIAQIHEIGGSDFPQVGPDGWAVTGGDSAPWPPFKAGDLSKFGRISNKGAPLTLGPQSNIYAGKKDNQESARRPSSSPQNVFSMLNNGSTAEATPKEMIQRKRLVLQSLLKPVKGCSDEKVTVEPVPIEMSNKGAKKKINEAIEEFSAVRNLDEAEAYFTQLPAKHHPLLVDKLISFAVQSEEVDAQLVSDLFSRASTKNLCSASDFERGFAGVLEFLEDIAIDVPMAFKLMATMMKGPAFDDKRLTRLALKTDSAKLLGLLSYTR